MQDLSGVSLSSVGFWESFAFVQRTLYYRIYGQVRRFWWGGYHNVYSWTFDFSDYTPDEFNQWLAGRGQDSDDANLITALNNTDLFSLADSTSGPITLLVFISRMNDSIVTQCYQAAANLRSKGLRLVLLALNSWLDGNLMVQLTGDRDTVQFWQPEYQAEPPNFQRWFDYTVGCQATRVKNFLTSEFFDGWTHPERIALYFSCTSSSKLYYPPDSFTSYTDLASVIDDQYSNRRDSCGQGRVGYRESAEWTLNGVDRILSLQLWVQ
ncbi:hypothetical protein M3Y99_00827900 [Aphelenchoides fujianensis]|nr:hypothetical protein M3Y99_00827900 [Aphelenchoides fujianensis]